VGISELSAATGQPVGSGSHENDGPIKIVAVEEEKQTGFVHHQQLRKGQGFADKPSQALPQGSIPAFYQGLTSPPFPAHLD
jgi:hypothetical protein